MRNTRDFDRHRTRPHVVHVSPIEFGAGGTFGGGERYPVELARAMARYVPTTLATFGERSDLSREGLLTTRVLPIRGLHKGDRLNPLSERLIGLIKGNDVVHAHQWESVVANFCVLLGRPLRSKVFATDHGGSAKNYWRRLRLANLLDGFLPVSDFAAGFYPELAGKTTTILGGVDTERYRPPGPAGDEATRGRHALFVGRLMPHKGIDVLIDSLSADTELVVVGRPYDHAFVDHLRALAVGKSVQFVFAADDARLLKEYQQARAVVLPSLHEPTVGPASPRAELLGLTMIEAMACAAPVVCTRTGGMPEVVSQAGGGEVVEPYDRVALGRAIDEAVRPGRAWTQRAQRARSMAVEKFSWDAVAVRCLAAYGSPVEVQAGSQEAVWR